MNDNNIVIPNPFFFQRIHCCDQLGKKWGRGVGWCVPQNFPTGRNIFGSADFWREIEINSWRYIVRTSLFTTFLSCRNAPHSMLTCPSLNCAATARFLIHSSTPNKLTIPSGTVTEISFPFFSSITRQIISFWAYKHKLGGFLMFLTFVLRTDTPFLCAFIFNKSTARV